MSSTLERPRGRGRDALAKHPGGQRRPIRSSATAPDVLHDLEAVVLPAKTSNLKVWLEHLTRRVEVHHGTGGRIALGVRTSTHMDTEHWARNVDPSVPSAARMYDYFLGGDHNFAADRQAARAVIEAMPDAPLIARVNRAFLHRAVRFLIARGVRQFLDIGSGVPTVGNVHEIAQRLAPDTRVVYADVDPIAVSHAQQMLAGNDQATAIVADLRRTADLLHQLELPQCRAVLDLARPVGLLMVSMLHFVSGPDAHQAVATLRDALVPGSYLVISHPIREGIDTQAATKVGAVYQQTTTPGVLRTRDEVARFFDGFALVPPGLVWVPEWHPDDSTADTLSIDDPGRLGMVGGVGRKTS